MSEQPEETHLKGLSARFMAALEQRRKGKIDKATEALQEILRAEPRLAEPRMELASIFLAAGQLEEAEAQAEEAISILEGNGQWTDELPPEVVLSLAWSLLGEAIRRQSDRDEVVFGHPDRWTELMDRAKAAFKKAEELDPHNSHASEWAFGLALDGEDEPSS